MNTKHLGCALVLLGLFALQATTSEPSARLLPPIQNAGEVKDAGKDQPKLPDKEKDKKAPEKKLTDPPSVDFTRTPTPIRDALGYNPQMIGDLGYLFANMSVPVVGIQTTTITQTFQVGPNTVSVSNTTTAPTTQQRTFLVPVPNHGAFKVGENASPIPIDRVYFSYNYFNAIRHPSAQNGPTTTTQTTRNRIQNITIDTTVTTVIPGAPFVDLHREVLGFEKTFLDGRASVDIRLPVFQQVNGHDDFRSSHMGDITVVGKYAFYMNRDTGDVISGGVAVTAPTGPSIQTIEGPVRSTLLQPWFGYVWNHNRTYLQAFHSVVLPTDSRDVSLIFNDVSVGFWAYRGDGTRPLRFIVPTAEVHVTTPLSNRAVLEPISTPDTVVLTGGVHVGIFRNSILTFGAGSPITGPRTSSVEAFLQFNRRF